MGPPAIAIYSQRKRIKNSYKKRERMKRIERAHTQKRKCVESASINRSKQ